MFIQSTKKLILFSILALAIGGGIAFYYYHTAIPKDGIYDFNAARDTKDIMDIFNKNWYWLLASDDSSPAFMIKHRTWDANPAHFGLMGIKVLREKDRVAGFTTYYMEAPKQGRLLFLAVDQDFRGKGYGTLLVKRAIQELLRMGATYIVLWTRVSNIPAQRIYKEIGFQEKREENGYLYFEYWPN